MNNILTYAKTNLKTFSEVPFNEIDSLILSYLSYLDFPKICTTQKEIPLTKIVNSEFYNDISDDKDNHNKYELLCYMLVSPRYKNIKVSNFIRIDGSDIQFSSVVFRINWRLRYVAFRGTDSSLAGWKENILLALEEPTNSQIKALEQLKMIIKTKLGNFIVGGHSKGGNMAVYSASMLNKNEMKRVLKAYSHDGPGFEKELSHWGFKAMKDKIHKTIPQDSIVGMLFHHECTPSVIHSCAEGGINQHEPVTWEIENDSFVKEGCVNNNANKISKLINTIIFTPDYENRKELIDALFSAVRNTKVKDFDEFMLNWKKFIPEIIKNLHMLNDETKQELNNVIKNLFVKKSEE